MELNLARSEGDFFRDMRYTQLPGVDSIWHQIWTDTVSDFPRLASSAAHVYGHPRAFTESFAAYRPAPDVTMARYILNEQFVRGINLIETMYYPAAVDGKGGPSAVMHEPGWPALMQYSSRLGFALSQGRPAAEVALLLPSSSLWMNSVQSDDMFVSSERLLSEHQVDFDIVDEDAIAKLLPLQKGAFTSMSGNRYRTVIVPSAAIVSTALAGRLREFADSGGKVIVLGALPTLLAEHNDLDARAATPADFAWATVVPADLPRVPTPPAQPPPSAPSPMVVPEGLWPAMQKELPSQVVETAPGTALRVLRREWKDAAAVMLFNESDRPFHQGVTLRRKGAKVIEAWDAQTGTVNSMPTNTAANGLRVNVQLPAYGAMLLVVH